MFDSHSFHVNEAIKTTLGLDLTLKHINEVAKTRKKILKLQDFNS